MANDYDPDGNPLAASKLSDPSNGSLAFNSNGSFSYTPNPSVFGPGATAHALLGTTFMPGQPKSVDINRRPTGSMSRTSSLARWRSSTVPPAR
jgi:hypothetical protein